MIKIFGFNIVSDCELEDLTNKNWEKAKKLLKINQLYRIKWVWEQKPKCPNCDKNRQIEVILPDGSKTKVSCSCASSKTHYEIEKVKDSLCFILRRKGRVWLSDGISDYSIYEKIVSNEKDLKKEQEQLDYCYYTTKKLAEKALKLFNEARKKRGIDD